MTTDSKTVTLTVLAKSNQAGQLTPCLEGRVEQEFPADRILGVTAHFGPGLAASIVTLTSQKGNGCDDVFQLFVLETKDVVFTRMSLAKGYDLTAARRPMDVPPMALPVAPAAAEPKATAKTPHPPRGAAVTAGSGF